MSTSHDLPDGIEPDQTMTAADAVARRVRTYQRYALGYALLGLILGVLSACTAREMLNHAHSNPWASIVGLSVLIPATVGGARAVCSGWAACRRNARAALDEQEEIPDDEDEDEPATTHGSNDDPFGKYREHGDESERALNACTRRAMRHGRRAAWCLLAGMTAEVLGLAGFVIAGWFAVQHDQTALGIVVAWPLMLLFTLVVAGVTHSRWSRHHDRMRTVVESAMVWRSDYQQMLHDRAGREALKRYDEARQVDEAVLAAATTWTVGEPPVFYDNNSYAALSAEPAHAPDLAEPWQTLFDRVNALPPMRQPRPARVRERHSDAEGRRLERELCSAVNKHHDGAFYRLLAEGANPNGHDGSGQPLRKAVLRGKLEHISWLIRLGADVNAQPFGRTILAAVMTQVEHFADEEERGDGDACEWPETIELLARFGANAHIRNRSYDPDDENEGPTAWPFIVKRPILYEAYMKGRAEFEAADADAHRLLHNMRESVQLDAVADETDALLRAVRGTCRA